MDRVPALAICLAGGAPHQQAAEHIRTLKWRRSPQGGIRFLPRSLLLLQIGLDAVGKHLHERGGLPVLVFDAIKGTGKADVGQRHFPEFAGLQLATHDMPRNAGQRTGLVQQDLDGVVMVELQKIRGPQPQRRDGRQKGLARA